VLLLTTVFTGFEFIQRIRRRPAATAQSRSIRLEFRGEAVKEMPMLEAAAAYNSNMSAVDIGDQLRATEGLDHRNRRDGWRAIAWNFLLEVMLVNSFLLQQRASGPSPWAPYSSQRQWRQRLVDDLVRLYSKTGTSRERFRAGDTFTAMSQHNHVNRGKSSRCVGCQGLRAGEVRSRSRGCQQPLSQVSGNSLKPTMTRKGCDVCNVAICTRQECWDFYHSTLR
jgi:hypothetical protein